MSELRAEIAERRGGGQRDDLKRCVSPHVYSRERRQSRGDDHNGGEATAAKPHGKECVYRYCHLRRRSSNTVLNHDKCVAWRSRLRRSRVGEDWSEAYQTDVSCPDPTEISGGGHVLRLGQQTTSIAV